MTTQSRGGAEFAAIEMLDALVDRGHEPVMLTDQPEMARDRRVPVRHVEIGPKLSTTSWRDLMLKWPRLVRDLRKALEAEWPYDVLLVHYKKEQLLAAALPKRLRATLVWCEWGPIPFPLRKGAPRQAYLGAARAADLILAISQGTNDNVVDVGVAPWKVVTVPNVLRTDEIDFSAAGRTRVRDDLRIPRDAFVVGCISRFHPKKRNDVVVEAVKLLDDERVHLVMAGDGETEASLREIGAPLGDRLHMVPTPGGNVGDVLSAFDVSVFCPSPTEGQPRATILAMLARRPALATGPEGVADMISPEVGGIASPENDPTALAALLQRYLDDPALVVSQGETGRMLAERTYAAPVVAELLERLFRQAEAHAARRRS
ncbi:MAG: glycosyltransferase family 4 protein [Solirubrobacteraceae bacterium]|nr:glycosyltransferase family 4 protein [Solirubrobacteraceae bacterium]